jgi:hypothetical protein
MASVTVGVEGRRSTVGCRRRRESIPRFSASLIGLTSLGFVGHYGHGERWFPCPGLPPFYCGAAREGVHCHTRQAPPIRAQIGSVSRSEDHIPNNIRCSC